jgi:pimeloyl-ACP methyl ester carboxylesterase
MARTSFAEESPAGASRADVRAASKRFISLLQQEKFDEAVKHFDATMQQGLPAAKLKEIWQATVAQHGQLQRLDAARVTRVDRWDVVDTPCDFEKSTIVIRISFDKALNVSGLFFLNAEKRRTTDDGPEIDLKTSSGTLYGTLNLPKGKAPWPVVLLIAGSGPTDRDGNQPQMRNDSLRLLGKALAAKGIAALRYDKRGIAKSAAAGADEENLRFENYADDAAAWVKQLRGDQRFSKVIILGHSEGSLVGILAAKKRPIDAFISIAGSGRNISAVLHEQLKGKLSGELSKRANHIIDELAAGRRANDVPSELMILFRPSVQPFLISWMKHEPAKEVAGLAIPILVIQGTTDLQISMEDAKALASGNRKAHLVSIENMNHVLKLAPDNSLRGQSAAYSDPALPLAPRLMDEIMSFLQEI